MGSWAYDLAMHPHTLLLEFALAGTRTSFSRWQPRLSARASTTTPIHPSPFLCQTAPRSPVFASLPSPTRRSRWPSSISLPTQPFDLSSPLHLPPVKLPSPARTSPGLRTYGLRHSWSQRLVAIAIPHNLPNPTPPRRKTGHMNLRWRRNQPTGATRSRAGGGADNPSGRGTLTYASSTARSAGRSSRGDLTVRRCRYLRSHYKQTLYACPESSCSVRFKVQRCDRLLPRNPCVTAPL